jgi:flagellar protein FliS
MYGKPNAAASYGRMANTESDPVQQVVMLYDGAIRFIRLAAEDIKEKKIAEKAEHVNRALDIVNYLQGILDFEHGADVAQTLDNLYTAVSMQILQASAKLDAQLMLKAATSLAPVRDSWALVATSAQKEALPAPPLPTEQRRLGHLIVG